MAHGTGTDRQWLQEPGQDACSVAVLLPKRRYGCVEKGRPQGALTVSEDGLGDEDQPGTMPDVGRRPGIPSLLASGHAVSLPIIGRSMIGGLTACSGHRSNGKGTFSCLLKDQSAATPPLSIQRQA